jgi:hypothetical protein
MPQRRGGRRTHGCSSRRFGEVKGWVAAATNRGDCVKDSTTVPMRIFEGLRDRCKGGWTKVVLRAHGVELYDVCVCGGPGRTP